MGIVMDPISDIYFYKDTSLALLLAASQQEWKLFYMRPEDLYQLNDKPSAIMSPLKVWDNAEKWFELKPAQLGRLDSLDVILMRQDPPVNNTYIYTTYLLEQAAKSGVLVINSPASVRDCNEKLFATQFPQCITDTLVSYSMEQIKEFIDQHQDVICKPLDGMGGHSIFRVKKTDPNINVILETMTLKNKRMIMTQRYLPEISEGDKRILIIDGKPLEYALARIPAIGETRGNLAAGGSGIAKPLTKRDREIVKIIAPTLKERGLTFVGIDVIGDYLTEINVTSPMGIRELNNQCQLDIAGDVIKVIEKKIRN